jgi:hypothetical protein
MEKNHIKFEHHLSERVMEIHFEGGLRLLSSGDLDVLKEAWATALKRWHSPYTCLFDCRHLEIQEDLMPSFEKLISFFKNFFMKKVVGFVGADDPLPAAPLPFPVLKGYEAAAAQTGLARGAGLERDLSSLRSRIQIDNDFSAHVMEVSFLADTHLESEDDLQTLRSKLQNILMMWHTPYSVVFNLEKCTFSPLVSERFGTIERFLRGFFCKDIVGYSPKGSKEMYPFPVYRSRHKAVGQLQNQGLNAGDSANCSSRKSTLS